MRLAILAAIAVALWRSVDPAAAVAFALVLAGLWIHWREWRRAVWTDAERRSRA